MNPRVDHAILAVREDLRQIITEGPEATRALLASTLGIDPQDVLRLLKGVYSGALDVPSPFEAVLLTAQLSLLVGARLARAQADNEHLAA